MAEVENEVAEFIEDNGCVDILVTADYSSPSSLVPKSITFLARGQECGTNGCMEFSITITNPSDLFNCKIA